MTAKDFKYISGIRFGHGNQFRYELGEDDPGSYPRVGVPAGVRFAVNYWNESHVALSHYDLVIFVPLDQELWNITP